MTIFRPIQKATRLIVLSAVFALSIPMVVSALPQDPWDATPTTQIAARKTPQANTSAAYLAAAGQLTQQGMDQEEIDVLWNRMGSQLITMLDRGQLTQQELEYLALPYCHQALMARYLAYAQVNPLLDRADVVTYVNIGPNQDFYQGVQPSDHQDSPLVLVNKYQQLNTDFKPEVVRLSATYGTGELTPDTALAFAAMADAARKEGITLRSVSAYRGYGTQERVYQRYLTQHRQSVVDDFSARPGHSEHQTGLALDINVARTSAHFENTPAYAWLVEHSWEYGFLLRYPQEKTHITGYRFEPWHYRYVGVEVATACTEQQLTFDEYVARLPVQLDDPGSVLLYNK